MPPVSFGGKMKLKLKIEKGSGAVFKDAFEIRTKVFVEEQGFVDEPDETDAECWHAVMYDNKRPISCGRMFSVGDGVFHIGRVAVLREYRGKHVGRGIMDGFERYARDICAVELELCSQMHAKGFYENCGYSVSGDVFYEQEQPHIKMIKRIR